MSAAKVPMLDLSRKVCVACGGILHLGRGRRWVRCSSCGARFKRLVLLGALGVRARNGLRKAYRPAPATPRCGGADIAEAATGLLLATTKALPMLRRHEPASETVRRTLLDAMGAASRALSEK